jgi:hypothetical protein
MLVCSYEKGWSFFQSSKQAIGFFLAEYIAVVLLEYVYNINNNEVYQHKKP